MGAKEWFLILLPPFFCLFESRYFLLGFLIHERIRISEAIDGKSPQWSAAILSRWVSSMRIGWSHQVSSSRFPEFDSMAFRVTQMRKPPIRVDRVIHIHGSTRRSKLGHHRIEIPDAEIDSPGVVGPACLIRR